jgi:hypothetical protein
MRYQLVLQFRGDSLADLDALVALEDRLIGDLGRAAKVDGNDYTVIWPENSEAPFSIL